MSQHIDRETIWRRRILLSSIASAVLGAGVVASTVDAQTAAPGGQPGQAQTPPPVTAPQSLELPGSFAPLVERVKPAVVNVSTTQRVDRERGDRGPAPFQMPPGSPFEDFFRRFFEQEQRPDRMPPPGDAHSLGSGFIIDPTGFIVTNNHVIGEAEEISVILHDGTRLSATVRGRDDKTDLALLKVEPEGPLPYVKFGNSSQTRVGDWILAVGNPFGLGGTVTAGIVSATGRDINAGPYDDFLQLDAAINRGNSGGPTFNLNGEVIGVNTAIFSPTGGNIGIGFAIPSNLATDVIAQLRETGQVERGWLGVQIQDLTPDIAQGLGLQIGKGALVADVVEGSPADKAGFQQGDIIVRFQDNVIENANQLPRAVAMTQAGTNAQVTVLRDGKEVQLDVTIGEMPSEPQLAAAPPPQQEADELGFGFTVSRLTPEVRQELGLAEDVRGVVVRDVEPNSEAARKGIRPGDVIVSVNRDEVTSAKEIAQQVDQAKKENRKSVVMLVNREGSQRYLALELPA